MPGPTDEHPDLSAVAGEMRAEWRAEQDAAAADAAALRRHGLTLADWLRERMHAGDRVRVEVLARAFEGAVDEVGDDLVALRTGSGRVEIHVCDAVPALFTVAQHARAGGTRSAARRTFRDALVARDGQPDLLVGTVLVPEGIRGTPSVARDFVAVAERDGRETVVALAHVAWVAVAPR